MKPAATTYSTAQVSRITGATPRMLQWWDERGILSPRFNANGLRSYSSGELVLAQIVAALRKKGMSLQQITVLLPHISRTWTARPRYIITNGDQVWLTASRFNVAQIACSATGSVIVARIGEPQ